MLHPVPELTISPIPSDGGIPFRRGSEYYQGMTVTEELAIAATIYMRNDAARAEAIASGSKIAAHIEEQIQAGDDTGEGL